MKFFQSLNYKNIALIVGLSCFMGAFYNMTTEKGLPLIREEKQTAWAVDSLFTDVPTSNSGAEPAAAPKAISLEQAYLLYAKHKAIFIDARDKWEFGDGHIKGAVNIPHYDFEAHKHKLSYPDDTILISYCGGEDCEMSLHLAEEILKLNKYKRVFYFKGGWQEWSHAGYPTEHNVQENN